MQIPAQITLVNAYFYLDGGTIDLRAVGSDGVKHSIQLNQRAFGDSYTNPGRLVFNGELVEVRSDTELQIIQLLKAAEFDHAVRPGDREGQGTISENAFVLSDDIKQLRDSSPQQNLLRFRNEIVAFVESEEYVRIATEGLPKN